MNVFVQFENITMVVIKKTSADKTISVMVPTKASGVQPHMLQKMMFLLLCNEKIILE